MPPPRCPRPPPRSTPASSRAPTERTSVPPGRSRACPQRAEYDSARAKNGALSGWITGPSTAAYAGVPAAETAGMSADGAEVRFWVYVDSANQNRVFTDGGASEVRLNTSARSWSTPSARPPATPPTPTPSSAPTPTGWTEYKLVYDFSADTYTLAKRTAAGGAWTRSQVRRRALTRHPDARGDRPHRHRRRARSGRIRTRTSGSTTSPTPTPASPTPTCLARAASSATHRGSRRRRTA